MFFMFFLENKDGEDGNLNDDSVDSHRKGQLYTKYWSNLPTTMAMQSEKLYLRSFDVRLCLLHRKANSMSDNCKKNRHAYTLSHHLWKVSPQFPIVLTWKPRGFSPSTPWIPTHVASMLVLGPQWDQWVCLKLGWLPQFIGNFHEQTIGKTWETRW